MGKYFLAPLIWALIIFILSSLPASDIPSFTFWLGLPVDKIVHFCMYGLLAFLLVYAFFRQDKKYHHNALKISIIICIIYGGSIELFQEYFLTDRHGEWLDMLANFCGIIAGIVVFRYFFRNLFKIKA